MSDWNFADDKPWVKFRCLEIATHVSGKQGAKAVVETAKEFEKFVMPKATVLNIKGARHEKENHRK